MIHNNKNKKFIKYKVKKKLSSDRIYIHNNQTKITSNNNNNWKYCMYLNSKNTKKLNLYEKTKTTTIKKINTNQIKMK